MGYREEALQRSLDREEDPEPDIGSYPGCFKVLIILGGGALGFMAMMLLITLLQALVRPH